MRWLPLFLLGGCAFHKTIDGASGDAPADGHDHQGAWLDGFQQREQIAIGAGAIVHAALPHFVVSVSGTLAPTPAIAFTGEDGKTPIPAEIVALDPATGAFDAWFPTTLQTGRDTHAYVYFDGALAAAPATDPVWDPTVFAGVWHMESDAQQNAPEAVASNTALAQAADIPGAMPGMAGGARSYDGSTLVAADAAAYHFAADHSFAYALWIDAARANTEFDIPFHKGGSSSGSHGFDMELGYNAWNLSIVDDDGMVTEYPVGDASLVGAWHQLVGVIDREQAEVYGYLDGAPAAAQPKTFHGAAFLTGTDEPVRIGRTDYPVTGLVDEVRIYATAPTADWFAAEYANLAHRDTFVSFGAPEPF